MFSTLVDLEHETIKGNWYLFCEENRLIEVILIGLRILVLKAYF